MLIGKQYKNNRPGLDETFYGSWAVEVIDPFGNRLSFNEKKDVEISLEKDDNKLDWYT